MLLASEELLRLQASLTLATLAAQCHLNGAWFTLLQVLMGNIGQGLDEDRVAIQTLCPLDARAVGFVHNLQVQLIQGLDVIAGKRNWHEDQVGLAALDIFHNSILRLGSKPCLRADLRLPAEAVGVAELQALHNGVDSCRHFGWVGVT